MDCANILLIIFNIFYCAGAQLQGKTCGYSSGCLSRRVGLSWALARGARCVWEALLKIS